MTMIYTADHVNTLVVEIRHWDPKDKDLRRIADVIPIDVLEAAYLAKLDRLPPVDVGRCAVGPQQKIAVMRKIYDAWLRNPGAELGVLIAEAIGGDSDQYVSETLVFGGDANLASLFEKRYPPRK